MTKRIGVRRRQIGTQFCPIEPKGEYHLSEMQNDIIERKYGRTSLFSL